MSILQFENRDTFEKKQQDYYNKCYQNYLLQNTENFIYQDFYNDIGTNIKLHGSNVKQIILPHTLLEIPDYFCKDCKKLRKIDLSNIINIGEHAFDSCFVLDEIGNLSKVNNIGYQAFSYCICLNEIDIPSCESIGGYSFSQCRGLSSISMLKVRNIGDYAFLNCVMLREIYLSDVTTIGNNVFQNCAKDKLKVYLYDVSNEILDYFIAEGFSYIYINDELYSG